MNSPSKDYRIDEDGFIKDFHQWDEGFAESMALHLSIPGKLTPKHWDVIYFIRSYYIETGICPIVYQACRQNHLRINEMQELFPSGYLRGACRLAGITYKQGYHGSTGKSADQKTGTEADLLRGKKLKTPPKVEKSYELDINGFLVDPQKWDEQFAIHKAMELKMQMPLTEKHWQIIYFLRKQSAENSAVPTVYKTCEAFKLEIEELENLFPDGYHRGAVKIAGLRVL